MDYYGTSSAARSARDYRLARCPGVGLSASPNHQDSNPTPETRGDLRRVSSSAPSGRRTPSARENPSRSTTPSADPAASAAAVSAVAVSRLRAPSSSQSFRDLLTVHPTCIASSPAIIAIAPRGDGGRPPRFANDVARNATTIGAGRHRATRAVPTRRRRQRPQKRVEISEIGVRLKASSARTTLTRNDFSGFRDLARATPRALARLSAFPLVSRRWITPRTRRTSRSC